MRASGGVLRVNNIIWDDFKFFFTRLKSLCISESITLGENGGFCVSTKTDYDNWVYYPEKINDSEVAGKVINFFNERNISFMWPLYGGGGEILESSGLLYAGDLTAMSYEPENIVTTENISFERVLTHEQAKIFAQTEFIGFGGDSDEPPENIITLFDSMKDDQENLSLFIARYKTRPAGTFAITKEENLTGVYYFCVMPEFRRKGIARAMMNEICRLSSGKKNVLQSTPAGVEFYKNFGFSELFRIPVYSNEKDIF